MGREEHMTRAAFCHDTSNTTNSSLGYLKISNTIIAQLHFIRQYLYIEVKLSFSL